MYHTHPLRRATIIPAEPTNQDPQLPTPQTCGISETFQFITQLFSYTQRNSNRAEISKNKTVRHSLNNKVSIPDRKMKEEDKRTRSIPHAHTHTHTQVCTRWLLMRDKEEPPRLRSSRRKPLNLEPRANGQQQKDATLPSPAPMIVLFGNDLLLRQPSLFKTTSHEHT